MLFNSDFVSSLPDIDEDAVNSWPTVICKSGGDREQLLRAAIEDWYNGASPEMQE